MRHANGAVEFIVSGPDPDFPTCIKTFSVVTGSGEQTRFIWGGGVRDRSLCTLRLVYGSSPPGYDISGNAEPLSEGREYSASFSTDGPTVIRQFRLEAAPLPAGATQVDVPTYY